LSVDVGVAPGCQSSTSKSQVDSAIAAGGAATTVRATRPVDNVVEYVPATDERTASLPSR
jgi:hypothetical protein